MTTRWDRLAEDLVAAGFPVRVDALPFNDGVKSGVNHSITVRFPGQGLVTIDDVYNRFDRWQGWRVTGEGTDDLIVGRPSAPSKNRREVLGSFGAIVTDIKRRNV